MMHYLSKTEDSFLFKRYFLDTYPKHFHLLLPNSPLHMVGIAGARSLLGVRTTCCSPPSCKQLDFVCRSTRRPLQSPTERDFHNPHLPPKLSLDPHTIRHHPPL